MDATPITVRGTVRPDGTLELDRSVSLPPGPVWVTIEPEPSAAPERPHRGLIEVLDEIHASQRARGFKGSSAEEIDADEARRRAEDAEEEERWRTIWSQTRSGPTGCPGMPDQADPHRGCLPPR
jgi:hypothetical protein